MQAVVLVGGQGIRLRPSDPHDAQAARAAREPSR